MGFREMIKRVQLNSGFSDVESKDALEMMVESLAVHLTEGERKDFASQLPGELQDLALSVFATEKNSKQDIIEQFMEVQHIRKERAKKQVLAAWAAIKEALTDGQLQHIQAQLPNRMLSYLR